jgi:genome maintenance exonuclease 1
MLIDKILQTRKCFTHTPKFKLNEELEQVNTETGRYYKTPTGLLYPSITTVVGLMNIDAIMQWRKRVGEAEATRISTKATKRGTKVHQLCEDYINGNDIDGSKYSITDVESFLALRDVIDENIDNVHCQEARLYSDYLQVAGTVDCVAEYAGRLAIIDFKTARKAKKEEYIQNYFCQATAYAIMYEERTGIPVPNIVIIVSVDDDFPQVFTDKRDKYVKQLLDVRKKYKELKGV